jgi:DNA-binding transcriptional ArsR family regulator
MRPGDSLATFAALLADRTRATFCLALLDGRAWTAGELARSVGVAPSTASEHLTMLIAGGLLTEERQGRHRYVRIADSRAAQMIEDIAGYAEPADGAPIRPTLHAMTVAAALRHGRTCYDHLAGHVGVTLIDAMCERGMLAQTSGFGMTEHGLAWLAELGIDVEALRAARRPLVRPCLDWTERRPHLAGSVAASMCTRFFDNGWIERIGSDRAVRVTPTGRSALGEALGIPDSTLRR